MFKTTKRILLVTAMTLSVAAPSAVADFSFTKYIDKSSPVIYQGGGAGSTTQPTQPAPPAK